MAKTVTRTTWESVAAEVAREIQRVLATPAQQDEWQLLSSGVPLDTPEATCQQTFARRLAETLVCLKIVGQQLAADPNASAIWDWLRTTSRPPFRQLFQAASPFQPVDTVLANIAATICDEHVLTCLDETWRSETDPALSRTDRIVRSYESLLHQHDRRRRGQYGVYYTPRSVTSHLVRSTHQLLQDEYGLADGLADPQTWREWYQQQGTAPATDTMPLDTRFVTVLDPALGTGAFFVEVVRQVHGYLTTKWTRSNMDSAAQAVRWQTHVEHALLPHLHGWEVILPAAALAHLALACQLAETGFAFQTDQGAEIQWKNSLAAPCTPMERQFTVVLGNPPYAALSDNAPSWITELLHGRDRGQLTHSYFEVAGEPLAERKVWLHDDYVKFLRLAQWLIERTSIGLVALITNRGFLDNVTFRGVRYQLMQSFNRIAIVDLHGGRRAHETTPTGEPDENVFDIEQGVAIAFLRRNPRSQAIHHVDLWGPRTQKENQLATHTLQDFEQQTLTPAAANFDLIPHWGQAYREYESGTKLTELMPIHTTAPVTARDGFVIAFTKAELLERVEKFADLSISDDRIRETFFGSNRSRRYPPGDTRSWKLTAARRRMADETDLETQIRTCWYRPFDRRQIFWADWMIDWPRSQVMQYFDRSGIALIARRQMLLSQPCNFFWITDDITLDGIIRSDNRGSESIFPLHDPVSGKGNLDFPSALQDVAPEDALHYIYGLFHLPSYRSRYADALRRDFPRVILPRDPSIFTALADAGKQLAELHLLRSPHRSGSTWEGAGTNHIERGYPKYQNEKIFVNRERWLAPVSKEVWRFRAGGHQVAHKWLKDRRGRDLHGHESETYQAIVQAISETLTCMHRIDQLVLDAGKMTAVFPP